MLMHENEFKWMGLSKNIEGIENGFKKKQMEVFESKGDKHYNLNRTELNVHHFRL